MKIALGSDHAGFRYKEKVKELLGTIGHEVKDFGTFSEEPVDYPLFIRLAAEAVVRGECERGIVFGGSGNGEAMAANKVRGVRCDVKHLCEAKTTRDSESYHERLDAFPTIKIVILRRVNQIETGDPTDHSRGQNDRCKIAMSSLGNPCPDRRDGQREAKKKMG